MKPLAIFLTLTGSVLAATQPSWMIEALPQARAGFDSNPRALSGAAAAACGDKAAFTSGLGLALAVASAPRPEGLSGRFSYTADSTWFAGEPSENFTSHRFGATGQEVGAGWVITGEGSSALIDGSRDPLAAISSVNANSIALWRERRAQWQHRAKLLAQRAVGEWRMRATSSWLDYDYRTHIITGRFAFADRSDLLGGLDVGRKDRRGALWFAGVRAGRQTQDHLALPGYQFEYSNRHVRPIAGWEGQIGRTTAAIAAGPDFFHYDGAVDTRVFSRRNHTSFWFEGSATTKLSPTLALLCKTTRWSWLASTGKSAYTDFSSEATLAWTVRPSLTVRTTAKAHQCAYFPGVRNDWESLFGGGIVWKWTAYTQLSAEWLWHEGWNNFHDIPDRSFSRLTGSLGVAIKL